MLFGENAFDKTTTNTRARARVFPSRCDHTNVFPVRCGGVWGPWRARACLLHHRLTSFFFFLRGPSITSLRPRLKLTHALLFQPLCAATSWSNGVRRESLQKKTRQRLENVPPEDDSRCFSTLKNSPRVNWSSKSLQHHVGKACPPLRWGHFATK